MSGNTFVSNVVPIIICIVKIYPVGNVINCLIHWRINMINKIFIECPYCQTRNTELPLSPIPPRDSFFKVHPIHCPHCHKKSYVLPKVSYEIYEKEEIDGINSDPCKVTSMAIGSCGVTSFGLGEIHKVDEQDNQYYMLIHGEWYWLNADEVQLIS